MSINFYYSICPYIHCPRYAQIYSRKISTLQKTNHSSTSKHFCYRCSPIFRPFHSARAFIGKTRYGGKMRIKRMAARVPISRPSRSVHFSSIFFHCRKRLCVLCIHGTLVLYWSKLLCLLVKWRIYSSIFYSNIHDMKFTKM